jgi:uncharacterized protein YrzB (UPF0473 family)
MADNEKKIDEIEEEYGETPVLTLTDDETGKEQDFELLARATIDEKLYYALVPAGDEECEEYVILGVTEDGDDIVFSTIEDDEEFYKVEEYFNDLLFSEVDYDN